VLSHLSPSVLLVMVSFFHSGGIGTAGVMVHAFSRGVKWLDSVRARVYAVHVGMFSAPLMRATLRGVCHGL